MTDIIERLRNVARNHSTTCCVPEVCADAVAEIERLRKNDIIDRLNRWLQYPAGTKIPNDLVGDLVEAVATIERLRKRKE